MIKTTTKTTDKKKEKGISFVPEPKRNKKLDRSFKFEVKEVLKK